MEITISAVHQESFLGRVKKSGVDGEVRTHDPQGHNLVLYQLSYIHHDSIICDPVYDFQGKKQWSLLPKSFARVIGIFLNYFTKFLISAESACFIDNRGCLKWFIRRGDEYVQVCFAGRDYQLLLLYQFYFFSSGAYKRNKFKPANNINTLLKK